MVAVSSAIGMAFLPHTFPHSFLVTKGGTTGIAEASCPTATQGWPQCTSRQCSHVGLSSWPSSAPRNLGSQGRCCQYCFAAKHLMSTSAVAAELYVNWHLHVVQELDLLLRPKMGGGKHHSARSKAGGKTENIQCSRKAHSFLKSGIISRFIQCSFLFRHRAPGIYHLKAHYW